MEISTVISIISVVIAIVAISLSFATLCMFTNLREDVGKFWTMEKAFNSYTDVLDSARREISRMNEYQANQEHIIKKQDADIKYLDGAYKNMIKDNRDVFQFIRKTISKETSYKEFRKKFLDRLTELTDFDGDSDKPKNLISKNMKKANYAVYRYEDLDGEFEFQIINKALNILKEGKYKTYSKYSVTKRTGNNTYTEELFFVFSSLNQPLTTSKMIECIKEYLLGTDTENNLHFMYPTLFGQ